MSSEHVAANLRHVLDAVAAAVAAAGRPAGSVRLVAVSKTQPAAVIRPALAAGHRRFGENRVQEAEGKWPTLRAEYPGIELHLIGPLQTNKVREAVALFDVIETVDRPKLARALAVEMTRSGRRPDCYVQVNTGEEPQKAGILPAEAEAFVAACRDEHGLPVKGLMCLPPADEDPEPHFRMLRDLARRTGLAVLSMGMSGDFPAAIDCGATHVRIGTAIFGARPRP